MNPTDADWWWQYGFGSLLAATATAVTVWLTLLSSRRLADLQEARALASQLLGVAWNVRMNATGPGMLELGRLSFELSARAQRRWPKLDVLLTGLMNDWSVAEGSDSDDAQAENLARSVSAVVTNWIAEPGQYANHGGMANVVRRVRRGSVT